MNTTHTVLGEIVLSLILIGLSVFLLDTFGGKMPDILLMTLSVVLIVVFTLFAGFIWQERAHDEREALHRMHGGRVGFLIGAFILVIGIVIQSFAHALDPWLVVALASMLIGKIAARAYSKLYQ